MIFGNEKIDVRKILGGSRVLSGMWELMEEGAHGDTSISDLGEQLDMWVWSSKKKSGRR